MAEIFSTAYYIKPMYVFCRNIQLVVTDPLELSNVVGYDMVFSDHPPILR